MPRERENPSVCQIPMLRTFNPKEKSIKLAMGPIIRAPITYPMKYFILEFKVVLSLGFIVRITLG